MTREEIERTFYWAGGGNEPGNYGTVNAALDAATKVCLHLLDRIEALEKDQETHLKIMTKLTDCIEALGK